MNKNVQSEGQSVIPPLLSSLPAEAVSLRRRHEAETSLNVNVEAQTEENIFIRCEEWQSDSAALHALLHDS